MGTKFGFEDQSTKITSSSEIDEILKQARSAPALDDDDDDDDIGDFGERTQIGNVAELVARSMTIEDPAPPPVIARSSTANVIRRPSTPSPVRRSEPMAAQRISEPMPAVRAQGSLSDITPVADDDDDLAFDPWEEKPVKAISQPMPIVAPPEIEEAPPPVFAPPPMMVAPPQPYVLPHVEPSVETPQPQAVVTHRGVRWGVIAWFMLLAAVIGAGTVGYLRISQLEGELAKAKIELQRANAR